MEDAAGLEVDIVWSKQCINTKLKPEVDEKL